MSNDYRIEVFLMPYVPIWLHKSPEKDIEHRFNCGFGGNDLRVIDADLFKNNVKTWAENIRDIRSDNKCFFTEENVLKAIDDQPTVDIEDDIKKLIGYWFCALEDEGCEPWENEECINMARKYGYTMEDYKKYLNTII